MNKQNIAELIHANYEGTTKLKAEAMADAIFEAITKSLAKGEDVLVSGFGIFTTKKRAARDGRNPKTGEKVHIPAMVIAKFKPSKALKDALK